MPSHIVYTESQRRCIVISVLALLTGCASNVGNMLAKLEQQNVSVELVDVPFHSQVTDQCGPAALATILNSGGIPVSPEALRSRVYIPGREGSLQLELLAATRHYGRIPYVIEPDVSAVLAELHSGRPVLILQNLGPRLAPVWHYSVVVGYLPHDRQFILRSGNRKRLLMSSRSFARTWQRANHWAIVALKPGDLPVDVVAARFLQSVSAFESAGDTASAVRAYRAATKKWPESQLAWLGLGNALYAGGKLQSARSAYHHALELDPGDLIAMNNLSQVHAELGCRDDALEIIKAALSDVAADDPMHRYLSLTMQEVKQIHSTSSCQQAFVPTLP